jgi:hypothetical protein
MAQIRRLKKDIDYMIFEVISDCFTYGSVHPAEKEAEVTEILGDAVSLRNDLIRRVNNPEVHGDPKGIRNHFHGVRRDLVLGVDSLFTRLSTLAGKKI